MPARIGLSIVCTSFDYKRLYDIEQLIRSIARQTYRSIETIVVVENSELYYALLSTRLEEPMRARIVFAGEEGGLSFARNLGIKHAAADIIAFVDDDVTLSPTWAEELLHTYEDETIIGVTGPAIPDWAGKSPGWFPDELSWLIGCTTWMRDFDCLRDVRNVGGMNYSFRREAFSRVGSHSEDLGYWKSEKVGWLQVSGEEVEFSLRVRRMTQKRIVFNPRVKVRHKIRPDKIAPLVLAKRAFRLGYSRHMVKRMFSKTTEGFLQPEYDILLRMILRVASSTSTKLFKSPRESVLELMAVFIAVGFTILGYVTFLCKPFYPEVVSTVTSHGYNRALDARVLFTSHVCQN